MYSQVELRRERVSRVRLRQEGEHGEHVRVVWYTMNKQAGVRPRLEGEHGALAVLFSACQCRFKLIGRQRMSGSS